jgi:hypothetical protein
MIHCAPVGMRWIILPALLVCGFLARTATAFENHQSATTAGDEQGESGYTGQGVVGHPSLLDLDHLPEVQRLLQEGEPTVSNPPSISPGPTVSPAPSIPKVLRFNFRFSFFEDDLTPNRDIVKEDVNAVMCQTQYFLSQLMQTATNTKTIHVQAKEISWGYYEEQEFPGHINFTVAFTDAAIGGYVDWADDRILISQMENLGAPGLQRFITDFVWQAEPLGYNFFANANRMAFEAVKMMASVQGQLKEAECPETFPPTVIPSATLMGPTISNAPSISPGRTVSSADNTNDMVYFTLQYRFKPGNAAEPTDNAMKSLICKTNLFFRDELRNYTGDNSLQAEATNINWYYNEENFEPLELTFTANVTTNDYKDTVPLQTVFKGMAVTEGGILRYIEFYIWESEPALYWGHVITSNFTLEANIPIPIGRLRTYQCPATDAPTMSPTTSPVPSMSPTTSPVPSLSHIQSNFPTISIAPTTKPPLPYPTRPPSNAAPTNNPMPTAVGGPAVRQSLTVRFLVSNLDHIEVPNEVNASGLSGSWPVFAQKVVANITSIKNSRGTDAGHRRLAVGLEPGSASVDSIERTECPDESHKDAVCHSTTAHYGLLLQGSEDPSQVEYKYGTATIAAIDDGSYQWVLDRYFPDTPLIIGIIREPKDPTSLELGDGNAMQITISLSFRVSNLENIKRSNEVIGSGLSSSFPVFTSELVQSLRADDADNLGQRRRLRVAIVPASPTVNEIMEYACPSIALPGLTCHSARASYDVIMSSDEDPSRINFDYTAASETAANDGTYNDVLQRVVPDTPLYIGIMTSRDQIPPASAQGIGTEESDENDGDPQHGLHEEDGESVANNTASPTAVSDGDEEGGPLQTNSTNSTEAPTPMLDDVDASSDEEAQAGRSVIMNVLFIIFSDADLSKDQVVSEYLETLEEAFDAFVDYLFLMLGGQSRLLTRQLLTLLDPESSKIKSIEPIPCPAESDSIPAAATCFIVNGEYKLFIEDEVGDSVVSQYNAATESAFEQGKLQAFLDAADPEYPLKVSGLAPENEIQAEPSGSSMAVLEVLPVVLGAAAIVM